MTEDDKTAMFVALKLCPPKPGVYDSSVMQQRIYVASRSVHIVRHLEDCGQGMTHPWNHYPDLPP